jgi:hypothetical protein
MIAAKLGLMQVDLRLGKDHTCSLELQLLCRGPGCGEVGHA